MNPLIEYVTGLSMVAGPNGAGCPPREPPVHTAIDAMGLAAFHPGSESDTTELTADDWDDIDRLVQDSLSSLTTRILSQEPTTTWKAGRTATRAFPLFSYRVFYHLDGNDYDPIVVGVTFTLRDREVRVAGDISGDETGFVYYDEGCTFDVPAGPFAVRDAGRFAAERLACQHDIVLRAIRNRHPRARAR